MMKPDYYSKFTDSLTQRLSLDTRVEGLVALGSMAARDYQPDQFSDHDFFVITRPGEQEPFRSDLNWLPEADRIVLSYRETAHGLKVLYDTPHLLEFAIFDREELNLARINRYRVLLDRGGIATAMEALHERTTAQVRDGNGASNAFHVGQVLTILYVGVCRYRRGECLSGHQFVKVSSLYHLLPLVTRLVPAERVTLLDNLDPFRRFDLVYPELGAELRSAFLLPVPEAAAALLALLEREIQPRLNDFPSTAVEAVRRFLRES